MKPPKLPGQTMLRFAGGISVICGGICLVVVIICLMTGFAAPGDAVGVLIFGFLVSGGVLGLIHAKNPAKAHLFIKFGAILLPLSLASTAAWIAGWTEFFVGYVYLYLFGPTVILHLIYSLYLAFFPPIAFLFDCILPVLYIWGGIRLRGAVSLGD